MLQKTNYSTECNWFFTLKNKRTTFSACDIILLLPTESLISLTRGSCDPETWSRWNRTVEKSNFLLWSPWSSCGDIFWCLEILTQLHPLRKMKVTEEEKQTFEFQLSSRRPEEFFWGETIQMVSKFNLFTCQYLILSNAQRGWLESCCFLPCTPASNPISWGI